MMAAARANPIVTTLSLLTACCMLASCQPQAPSATADSPAKTAAPDVPVEAKPPAALKPPAATQPALSEEALTPFDKLSPPVKAPVNSAKAEPIPPRAKKLVIDAYKRINRRDFAGAIDLLERAKGYGPTNPRIHRALGIAYAGLPDRGRAAKSLRLAARQVPDDLHVQLVLGGLAYRNKQSDQAIIALRTALKCSGAKPSSLLAGEALLNLARILEHEGYTTASVECYTRLARWVRRHGGAYRKHRELREMVRRPEMLLTRRGALLYKLRRREEAIKLLERSYRLNRTGLLTARLLVKALLETRQFDRTEALLLNLAGERTQSRQIPALVESMIRATGDKKLPAKIHRAAGRRGSDTLGVAMAALAERLDDREQAVEILEGLLAAKPDSPEAARRLAQLHAGRGQAEAGLKTLARVLAANPSAEPAVRAGVREISDAAVGKDIARRFAAAATADANDPRRSFSLHYIAGLLARRNGETDFAAQQYRKTFNAKKDFLPAYAALTEIHLEQKRFDRAEKVLAAVEKIAQDGFFVDYLRGRIELARGNIAEALTALQNARKRNRRHVPTLVALAEAHMRNGQVVDTISILRAATKLRPDDAGVARRLFDLYVDRKEYPQAARVAVGLLRARPGSPAARLMQAQLLLETGKIQQARRALKVLAARIPRDPEVILLRLRADVGADKTFPPKKKFDDLVKRLDEAIKSRPGDVKPSRMLAELNTRVGRDAEAAKVWKRLYDGASDKSTVAEPYGRSLSRSGQHAAAAGVLKARLAADPGDRDVRQALIGALTQLKKFDEAAGLLKKWIADADEYQKLRYRFGLQEIYEAAERYDQLQEFLDRWMASDSPGTSKRALRARKVRVFAEAGKLDQAIAYTEKWLKTAPTDMVAKEVLVEALLDQKAFKKVAPLLDKWAAGAENEEIDRLRRLRIIYHWRAEQPDKAERAAMAWIRHAPDDMEPRRMLVSVLADLDRHDRAATLLAGWIKENTPAKTVSPAKDAAATKPAPRTRPAPRSAPAAATAQAAKSRPAKPASAPVKPAPAPPKRLSPEDLAWCREMHVVVMGMAQKYAEALKLAEAYLRIDPDNASLLDQKSTCMTELGRHAEALTALKNSHRLRTKHLGLAKAGGSPQLVDAAASAVASASNNLSYVYAENGVELQRAEDLATAAVRVRPVSAFIDTLGWVYYKRDEMSKAGTIFLELLREAEDIPEMHPVMLDHAGDVYYRLGWKQRAGDHWRRALAEAKKEKRRTAEITNILKNAPKKIQALKEDKTPPIAPLGKGVEDALLK